MSTAAGASVAQNRFIAGLRKAFLRRARAQACLCEFTEIRAAAWRFEAMQNPAGELKSRRRCDRRRPHQPVGWAKRPDANASGGVPTIQFRYRKKMVGTAPTGA